jgi:hypothetical protein
VSLSRPAVSGAGGGIVWSQYQQIVT